MKHETAHILRHATGSLTLNVRRADSADATAWDRFVLSCTEATFFHRFGWKQIMEDVFDRRTHYLLAEQAGDIVAVLPLAEVRSWLFGRTLVSLPLGVYGGVASSDARAVAPLHAKAGELAVELDVDYLELRNVHPREPEWPRQDLYVTFRKEILPEVEANMLAIPRKQRAMVRKGIKAGLTSDTQPSSRSFYQLYADNMHRHGTPALPARYFETLRRVFGSDCEILTVFDPRGQAVSSVLSFYFRNEVLPYYAGDLTAARDLAANDFKYWELLRRACESGRTVFDYGRSKRGTGSFAFKKNWGFEPQPLHYEFGLLRRREVPQNNPLNPKYRLFVQAWRRLPRPVANFLAAHVVRHLT